MNMTRVTAAAGFAMLSLLMADTADARRLPEGPPPPQVLDLVACRSISDAQARLACFDKAVAVIDQAVTNRDLVVFDREAVTRTKKGLFGFGIPNLGIFGSDDNSVEVKQIDGVIAGVGQAQDGYIFRLEDKSRWVQTDGKMIALEPRVGDKVTIKRGAITSYILSVGKQPGVKVRRTE